MYRPNAPFDLLSGTTRRQGNRVPGRTSISVRRFRVRKILRFQDLVASISLRESERGTQIGLGWDPHWHQPTDMFATFDDKDFRLGLNAAQTTLAAVAQLAGVTLKK